MAMRRPRTNSRLTTKSNQQGFAEREEDGGERGGKPRVSFIPIAKRKLSDMLGPPWSKEDLELFYQAYRKFGKDWRKVAGSMQKRTMEMVEALYGMNRAYLSLPEGAASAAGLIAMMTDHYNILDESEEESSEEFGTFDRSHQTNSRLRTRAATVSNTNMGPSGYGGPSPAKKPRSAAASRPWMVGKRTPRYPVGNLIEQKGKSKTVGVKVPQEETSDEENDFTKEAAVVATLVTGLQQAPSPLVLKDTPTRRNSRAASQNGHVREPILKVESGVSVPKYTASTSADGGPDRSRESKEKPAKASNSATIDETELPDGARGQVSDCKSRWKRLPTRKLKSQKVDIKYEEHNEQCSQTEIDEEDTKEEDEEKHVSVQKTRRQSLQRTKKRSRQLFSADQNSALDALVTLANLSLNGLLSAPTLRSDSQEKEEDRPHHNLQAVKGTDKNGKEVEKKEGHKKISEEERPNEQMENEGTRVVNGSRQQSISPPDSRKRKRKTIIEKLGSQGKAGAEHQGQCELEQQVPPPKVETPVVLKPRRKPKRLSTVKPLLKGVKVTNGLDLELSVQVPAPSGHLDEGTLPLKLRSKKKGVAEKGPVNGFGDVGISSFGTDVAREASSCPHTTAELGPFNNKARLIHCLSPKVRRWCMYEWFYSAIDLPWFAHNEFVEYLNHAGLGHVPRLTRVEWGVIRSSLGRPRRLSDAFLKQERAKLGKYREDVRTHYHELRGGLREGLPSDLARPLTVGQRVIARHPKTRQIHDGSILTVDRSRCRVQFDRPELGVEFVMDVDAMPIHPLDNMPEVMRRKRIVFDAIDHTLGDSKLEEKLRLPISAGGAARAALNERLERPGSIPGGTVFSQNFVNSLTRSAQANSVDSVRLAKAATSEAFAATQQALRMQPCTPGQSQAREADIQILVELGGALTEKEALVVELRRMNDETASYKNSEAFQRQYATIIQQLKDVNDQVLDALKHLRHRHRYQDSGVSLWHRAASQEVSIVAGSNPEGSFPGSLDVAQSIADIAASSKKHARAMVSVAVQSMSALKEGEDPLAKLGGALDLVIKGTPAAQVKCPSVPVPSMQGVTSIVSVGSTAAIASRPSSTIEANGEAGKLEGDIRANNLSLAGDEPTSMTEDAASTKLFNNVSCEESTEARVLSELMASCVATLLMVQTLTERQFPAPDVAITLDNALESLRPQAAQNHCIFKDIEQQLGYIKTQILAQIPIPSTVPFPVETPTNQPVNPT